MGFQLSSLCPKNLHSDLLKPLKLWRRKVKIFKYISRMCLLKIKLLFLKPNKLPGPIRASFKIKKIKSIKITLSLQRLFRVSQSRVLEILATMKKVFSYLSKLKKTIW